MKTGDGKLAASAPADWASRVSRLPSLVFHTTILLAPILAPLGAQSPSRDSSSVEKRRALTDRLANASTRNVLPADLMAYRVRVETEISVLMRREDGGEAVAAVEQVASTLRWTRGGVYDQHTIGYRAHRSGPSVSMLSVFQTGWLNPTLYGNRLRVRTRASRSAARSTVRGDGADTLPAVHPLAEDRTHYYTYSGGDTIIATRVEGRTIAIVRVHVMPRGGIASPVVLFEGDMDLDASRDALIRMRGALRRAGESPRRLGGALSEAVAYIDYEQGERLGTFWLPATQRIEFQATLPLLGDGRAVIRLVSRFSDMVVNPVLSAETPTADSLRATGRRQLSFASKDSIKRFTSWIAGFGVLSAGLHSDDFLDIAPDRYRLSGTPRVDWVAPRTADIFHFNRVEGVYTGYGLSWSLRDRAPGVVIHANAGWAWNEQVARGRLAIGRTSGSWTTETRVGRSLDNTNDFPVPFDTGSSFGALFASQDPNDYVDRRAVTLSVAKVTAKRGVQMRTEFGLADDRYRPATYARGPLMGGKAYRANRGVDEGSYVRTAVLLEWHPDVSAEFLKTRAGARLSYERGDGTLRFQRIEARVEGRLPRGPFLLIGRGDVGALLGTRPPAQQLFELGEQQNLPGYRDKEFAGTRAAVMRASLQYASPFLRQPVRVRRFFLPPVTPGLSVGVQSGWADAQTAAARAAIDRLVVIDPTSPTRWAPVSRPSDGIRASVTAGFRVFSGGVFIGATRPVDHSAHWKTLVAFGQRW